MNGLIFTHGVVCDDIRQENNGKFMIIGMYTGSLIPPKLPYLTKVAFGVWATAPVSGEYHCDFQFILEPEGKVLGGAEIGFELQPGETQVFLPLPALPANIGGPGFIVLRDRISDTEIIRVRVSSPSEHPQPDGQPQPASPESSSPPEPSRPGSPKRRRRI